MVSRVNRFVIQTGHTVKKLVLLFKLFAHILEKARDFRRTKVIKELS